MRKTSASSPVSAAHALRTSSRASVRPSHRQSSAPSRNTSVVWVGGWVRGARRGGGGAGVRGQSHAVGGEGALARGVTGATRTYVPGRPARPAALRARGSRRRPACRLQQGRSESAGEGGWRLGGARPRPLRKREKWAASSPAHLTFYSRVLERACRLEQRWRERGAGSAPARAHRKKRGLAADELALGAFAVPLRQRLRRQRAAPPPGAQSVGCSPAAG